MMKVSIKTNYSIALFLLVIANIYARGPIFMQSDWSGGNSQQLLSDTSMYSSDDGNINISDPSGEFSIYYQIDCGDGSDGDITVSSLDSVVNTYTYVTDAMVTSSSTVINIASTSGFYAGDEILIYQTQHSSIAGRYEFAKIKSIQSGTSLELEAGLDSTFYSGTPDASNASIAQVVRVPQFGNVTIMDNSSITAKNWDGYSGGVVVFRVKGTLSLGSGSLIEVDSSGFRGGAVGLENNEPGTEGEGVLGKELSLGKTSSPYVTHSTGINNGGAPGSGVSHAGGGGGGGGHATVGGIGQPNTSYPDTAYGGNSIGSSDMRRIYFGGGGGGGGDDDNKHNGSTFPVGGADGGNGGGIIIVYADSISGGTFSSRGGSKGNTNDAAAAEGSGGAGGSVILYGKSINSVTLNVDGGTGSNLKPGDSGFNSSYGYGGDGSNGRIAVGFGSLYSTTLGSDVGLIDTLIYPDSSYLISSVLYYGENDDVYAPYIFSWNSTLNGGSLKGYLRSSETLSGITSSPWVEQSNGARVAMGSGLSVNEPYVQYMFVLKPDGSKNNSPVIYDATLEFAVRPDSFALTSPLDGSEVSLTPYTTWQLSLDTNTGDSILYKLEIDDNNDFSSPEVIKTGLNSNSYFVTSSDSLKDNTAYYWRVWAYDSYMDSTKSMKTFVFFTDVANNIPTLSIPLSPVPNTECGSNDTLFWTRNDADPGDTLKYNIRIATDQTFKNILASKSDWSYEFIEISDLDNVSNLIDGTIYYWQVEAHDPDGASSGYTSGLDSIYFNSVNDTPSVPFSLYPVENTAIGSNSYLKWKATDEDSLGLTPDTLTYTVVIDNNSDFSTPIGYTVGIKADSIKLSSVTNFSNILDDTKYYWKVMATDNHGLSGKYSDGSHNFYFNNSNTIPSVPTQVEPVSGASGIPKSFFRWNKSIDSDFFDTTRYVFELSSTSDFSSLIFSDTIRDTSIIINSVGNYRTLTSGNTYYWRVKGIDNQDAESGWSSTYFNFISTPTSKTTLVLPSDGSIYFPTEPIIWHTVGDTDAGADDFLTYILQTSAEPLFSTIIDSDTGSDTTLELSELKNFSSYVDNSQYYWRISVVDNHGAVSDWSDAWSFQFDKSNNPPSEPSVISPIDSTICDGSYLFKWNSSTDPDPGSSVTYGVLASTDSLFSDTVLFVEAINDTAVVLDSLNKLNTIILFDSLNSKDTAGFIDNSFYYWSVFATDNHSANSDAGSVGLFYSNLVDDTPAVATGLSPDFGAITFPTQYLKWHLEKSEEFGDILFSTVEFSDDSLFSNIVVIDTIRSDSSIQIYRLNNYDSLVNRSTYYWRIKTFDLAGNTYGYSDTATIFFSTENSSPEIVTGLFPSDTSQLLPTDTLFWNKTDDNEHDSIYYYISISTEPVNPDSDSVSVIATSEKLIENMQIANLIQNGYSYLQSDSVYYFFVRAEDQYFYNSEWSAPGVFRFKSTPPPVVDGLLPQDSSEVSTSDTLQWNSVVDVDSGLGDTLKYIVVVDSYPDFTANVSVDTVSTSALPIKYMDNVVGLTDDNYYYWKVAAFDQHGEVGQYSVVSSFYYNKTNTPPKKPDSLTPNKLSSIRDFEYLRWRCSDPDKGDTIKYRIEFSRDSAFSILFTTIYNWKNRELQISQIPNYSINFSDEDTIYWRVTAIDMQNSVSETSDWSSFIYDDKDNIATSPVIIKPVSGGIVYVEDSLRWLNSYDPDDDNILYHVDISTDSVFSSIVAVQDSIAESDSITGLPFSVITDFSKLKEGVLYYLRVYPISVTDSLEVTGNSSDIFNFWFGVKDSSVSHELSSVTVINNVAIGTISNVAYAVDSMFAIQYPTNTVVKPAKTIVSKLPVNGIIDSIGDSSANSELRRLAGLVDTANLYAKGNERIYNVRENSYSVSMKYYDDSSYVTLADSVIIQLTYHDSDNDNFLDGEERIPVDYVSIFKLDESNKRWHLVASRSDIRKRDRRSKDTKLRLKNRDRSVSYPVTTTGIYAILAYKRLEKAFDNFKVYPSPAVLSKLTNNKVTISYWLREEADVDIAIFSETGSLVWKLSIPKGEYGASANSDNEVQIPWNLRNSFGRLVSNGMYVVKIRVKPVSGGLFTSKQYIGVVK